MAGAGQSMNQSAGADAMTNTQSADRLAQQWAHSLREAFLSIAGNSPEVRVTASGTPHAEGAQPLCWEQPFTGIAGSTLWIASFEPSWTDIGRRCLTAAGIEESDSADQRSTYLELISQALAAFSRTVGSHLAAEVSCSRGVEVDSVPADAAWFEIEMTISGEKAGNVFVGFSAGLVDLGTASSEEAAGDLVPLTAHVSRPGGTPRNADSSTTFDLLLEVEMPVSVSFGRAQLPLRDVLKLTTGSIVELNRGVVEPVEIIVNNCVIARGEVVVLDGNYGVRIDQIISRQERLRTLT
jgi:flagellar motor switch protein FliN/FliY